MCMLQVMRSFASFGCWALILIWFHRGDPDELDRANDVLDLLVDIDGAFGRLAANARADVQSAIFCGEYEQVREAAQIVKTYASILELGDRYPDDQRFPAFTEFLRDVASELDQPLTATTSDAAAAEGIRLKMSELLRQLADSRAEQDQLIKVLWADFPDWQASALQGDITLTLSRFEAMLGSILNRDNSIDQVAELLAHLNGLSAELRLFLADLAGGRKIGWTDLVDIVPREVRTRRPDQLCLRLRQSISASIPSKLPSSQQFKRIKRNFWMKTHPDQGGTNDAFRECMDHCRIIEDHLAPA